MKNKYKIIGDYVEVYVTRRNGDEHTFLIDLDDFERLEKIERKFSICGRAKYIVFRKNSELYSLHRIILSAKKGEHVDHVNNDTLDNRKENLRVVTQQENNQNLSGPHKNNKLGIRGVFFRKDTKKYQAKITHNYKDISLGCFDCKYEAEKVVIAKREELGFLTNKR